MARTVVDGMNVIGSRPDGWWRDRDAAARRLLARLQHAVSRSHDALTLVLDGRPPADVPEGVHVGVEVRYARRRGRDAADDAFQETFLRALRGYQSLQHGRHLRAWAYRIATRVAIDERRKRRPTAELPELPADDGRPAYAELDHLTGDLPATERAAVVLRYGYDLDYADIATALGSSEDAARQAASSGVRRLRRRMT